MTLSSLPRRRNALCGTVPILVAATLLPGCASLPVSGPTGSEIRKGARGEQAQVPFTLVEVDRAAEIPPPPVIPAPVLTTLPPRPTNLLGPGDVLNITIYEAGVALF